MDISVLVIQAGLIVCSALLVLWAILAVWSSEGRNRRDRRWRRK